MTLITNYRKFKADLQGYLDVSFEVYRREILPLRAKKENWTAAEVSFIRALIEDGAGYALQRVFGKKHPAAIKMLGDTPITYFPMTKLELDEHMRSLVKNCTTAGWTAQRFTSFAAYLDSNMTPEQLVEQDRERRRDLAAAMASNHINATAPTVVAPDDWDTGEAPGRDTFADTYRSAGPAFKRAVNDHLAAAARKVASAPVEE